jgi:hypothetical protein
VPFERVVSIVMNAYKSIVVIGVYFGKFQDSFPLWLKSCEYNPTVNWLVFTDQSCQDINNVKFIKMDLEHFNELASQKLNLPIKIERPYKLCDFKPAYGKIFESYIEKYDFWGHCDFDLIWGDIRAFLTTDILDEYDKILYLGHLSLYRNNEKCNNLWRNTNNELNPQDIFCTSKHFAFDEIDGIYQICKQTNIPIYEKVIYADISSIYKRFRCATAIEKRLKRPQINNYKLQAYFFENGKVYRAYIDNGLIKYQEFIYMHFKERKFSFSSKNFCLDSFYIGPKGFVSKDHNQVTKEIIKQINPYNFLSELSDRTNFELKALNKNVARKLHGINYKGESR